MDFLDFDAFGAIVVDLGRLNSQSRGLERKFPSAQRDDQLERDDELVRPCPRCATVQVLNAACSLEPKCSVLLFKANAYAIAQNTKKRVFYSCRGFSKNCRSSRLPKIVIESNMVGLLQGIHLPI